MRKSSISSIRALAELENLRNAAVDHRNYCEGRDCNISLFQLRQTAKRLLSYMLKPEKEKANKIISENEIWL